VGLGAAALLLFFLLIDHNKSKTKDKDFIYFLSLQVLDDIEKGK
jgi:hypothetical protein